MADNNGDFMQFDNFKVGGEVVKQDARYTVTDNKLLKNLVVSSTLLHPEMATSGHKHAGQEEVYFFINGYGEMQLGDLRFKVSPGSIVQIEDGVFHRVFNTSDFEDLYFVCVFDGKRNH